MDTLDYSAHPGESDISFCGPSMTDIDLENDNIFREGEK